MYYILLKTQNEIIFTLVTLKMLLYKKKKLFIYELSKYLCIFKTFYRYFNIEKVHNTPYFIF